MVNAYLSGRPNLKAVILILDIRRTPGVEEADLRAWLRQASIPEILVLTKVDKLSRSQQLQRLAAVARDLDIDPRQLLPFSAKSRLGRDAVWDSILRHLNADVPLDEKEVLHDPTHTPASI